jgi:hypothetical protein
MLLLVLGFCAIGKACFEKNDTFACLFARREELIERVNGCTLCMYAAKHFS